MYKFNLIYLLFFVFCVFCLINDDDDDNDKVQHFYFDYLLLSTSQLAS